MATDRENTCDTPSFEVDTTTTALLTTTTAKPTTTAPPTTLAPSTTVAPSTTAQTTTVTSAASTTVYSSTADSTSKQTQTTSSVMTSPNFTTAISDSTVGATNATSATSSATSPMSTTANVSTSQSQVTVMTSQPTSLPTLTSTGVTSTVTRAATNGTTGTNVTLNATITFPTIAVTNLSTVAVTKATNASTIGVTTPTASSSTVPTAPTSTSKKTATVTTPAATSPATSTVISTTSTSRASTAVTTSASTSKISTTIPPSSTTVKFATTSSSALPTSVTSIKPTTTLLPTVAPSFVRYPVTSDYYFPYMERNCSSTTNDPIQVVRGPFGFDTGVQLTAAKESCLSTSSVYRKPDLPCLQNPTACSAGISLSIWENVQLNAEDRQARYIVSSGGDSEGRPGLALYHLGVDLHAVVSNGTHHWSVYVDGPVASNVWSNIGVRFNLSNGLEVYVDQEKVASVIYPVPSEGTPQAGLSPPELAVGCRVLAGNPRRYANFSDAQLDEMAVWMHGLNDSDLPYFMGGFDPNAADLSLDDFKAIIKNMDMSDPVQNQQATEQLKKMSQDIGANSDSAPTAASASATSPTASSTHQATTSGNQSATNSTGSGQLTGPQATDGDPGIWLSPSASSAASSDDGSLKSQVDKLQSISDIVKLMTDPTKIKKNMSLAEMSDFQNLLEVISNMFSTNRKSEWTKIQKEKGGSPDVVNGLMDWSMALLKQLRLFERGKPKQMSSTKTTDNVVLSSTKMTVQEYKDNKGVCTPDYSSPEWNNVPWARGTPKMPLDTVQFPRELFQGLSRDPGSDVYITNLLFRTYGDIAPLTVNKNTLPSERVFLDSKVITINMSPSRDLVGALYYHPLIITLAHNKREKALRQILFHDENQTIPTIKSRYCARWNPNVIPRGGWDSSRCDLYHSSEEYSVCYCEQMGSYAILAQNIERRLIYPDPLWLTILKYTFYGLSIVLLIIYMLIIIFSKYLKDQFHIIRLNMAFTVLAGTGCMLATDFVRGQRHECTAVTALLHFFYASVGCWLLVEAHALFAAIQYGIIGGKLKAYFPFAYGFPMFVVGLAFLGGFQDYGLEPRCMVSWNDNLKWTLFAPNLLFGGCAAILAAATIINTSFAALKKEHLFEDLGSVSWGLFAVVVTYSFNWVFACLAYLDIELMSPDFYPIFQVLNAGLGLMIFLFMGLGSKRFRIVARGGTPDSRHFPLMNQKDPNLVPVKPQPKQIKGPLQG